MTAQVSTAVLFLLLGLCRLTLLFRTFGNSLHFPSAGPERVYVIFIAIFGSKENEARFSFVFSFKTEDRQRIDFEKLSERTKTVKGQ